MVRTRFEGGSKTGTARERAVLVGIMTIDDEVIHRRFLGLAIDEATRRAGAGPGGPFAALVVLDGAVLAVGWNEVTSAHDPTAHAEVQAIRKACAKLGRFQLAGCDVYASCEPCPMCMGALWWARPRSVHYAATRADAAAAGFDDSFLHDELARRPDARRLPFRQLVVAEAGRPFEVWLASPARIPY